MSDDGRRGGDGVLPFPGEPEDAELGARIALLYRATPSRGEAEAARCAAAVLDAAAARRHDWRRHLPRQRWWWGAAAAALLVAVTMRPWRPEAISRTADSVLTPVPPVSEAPSQPVGAVFAPAGGGAVRFELTLPAGARDVSLVGDFNGWDDSATPMRRSEADGAWSAQVSLPPGRHVYAFVVDGQRWLVDPMAPQVPDAGFGPANALIVAGTR